MIKKIYHLDKKKKKYIMVRIFDFWYDRNMLLGGDGGEYLKDSRYYCCCISSVDVCSLLRLLQVKIVLQRDDYFGTVNNCFLVRYRRKLTGYEIEVLREIFKGSQIVIV